jgi:hypothetical protein
MKVRIGQLEIVTKNNHTQPLWGKARRKLVKITNDEPKERRFFGEFENTLATEIIFNENSIRITNRHFCAEAQRLMFVCEGR